MIVSKSNGITLFGNDNLIENSGSISARLDVVSFFSGSGSQLVNTGRVTTLNGNASLSAGSRLL